MTEKALNAVPPHNEEAERAYERVVREFADQEEMVDQARVRLTALRRSAAAPGGAAIQTRRLMAGNYADGEVSLAGGPTPDGHIAASSVQQVAGRFMSAACGIPQPFCGPYGCHRSGAVQGSGTRAVTPSR